MSGPAEPSVGRPEKAKRRPSGEKAGVAPTITMSWAIRVAPAGAEGLGSTDGVGSGVSVGSADSEGSAEPGGLVDGLKGGDAEGSVEPGVGEVNGAPVRSGGGVAVVSLPTSSTRMPLPGSFASMITIRPSSGDMTASVGGRGSSIVLGDGA